ncbi:MAG TPA: CysB family HTH-type transcriptional regulator [Burkholderiales bacterium]|nr:CysB family HTH-type transcriptional regulator [Burkholderiales bacterium]
MKIEQLRNLVEIVRHGYSVSRAAAAMHTPQPAVSRQLRALERELGVDIFRRNPKRLLGLTRPGEAVLEVAERILADTKNLTKIAHDYSRQHSGSFTIATTHTQARYALPRVLQKFSTRYPDVELMLRQGTPAEIVELVRLGEADLCIGSDASENVEGLAAFRCYEMHRIVLTPPGHPLLKTTKLTLEKLAAYPIITYDAPFIGRSRLVRAFHERGLKPKIVLSAIDTDVIKAYVELGLGIAIVAELAYDRNRDRGLRALPAKHLFEPNTIHLAVRRSDYLRDYVYEFIRLYAPHLTRDAVVAGQRTTPLR